MTLWRGRWLPSCPMIDGPAAARLKRKPRPPLQGAAALYRDEKLLRKLVDDGLLTEASLCVGVVVETPVLLRHQKHDVVCIPPGLYYVGRQREFHAGKAREVSD